MASCSTELIQSYRNMLMVTRAAKGNGTILWLHWHLPEGGNQEMFEGFSAFWSSSETGFTRAGFTSAGAPD